MPVNLRFELDRFDSENSKKSLMKTSVNKALRDPYYEQYYFAAQTRFSQQLTSGAGNTGTAYTQTWPAAVKWQAGSAPTLTQGETKVDVLVFITDDGGTTWRGAVSILDSR